MKSVPWFYIKLVFVRFQGKEGNIAHFICIALGIKSVFPLLRRIFSSSEVSRQNIETFRAGLLQMLLRWGFTKRLSWYLCDNNKTIKLLFFYNYIRHHFLSCNLMWFLNCLDVTKFNKLSCHKMVNSNFVELDSVFIEVRKLIWQANTLRFLLDTACAVSTGLIQKCIFSIKIYWKAALI